jgi:hypothetical protein
MSVKRSEAEVLGHDNTLHAAIDELTHGRRGADPLHDDADRQPPKVENKDDRAKLYRYGEYTVPPDVLKAMAAVDLRSVDEHGAAPQGSIDTPSPELPLRRRWPALVLVAALVVMGVAAWLFGSAREREELPLATSAMPASPASVSAPVSAAVHALPSAEVPSPLVPSALVSTSEPAPEPVTPKANASPRPAVPPSTAPEATTTEPSDPDFDPDRPFF